MYIFGGSQTIGHLLEGWSIDTILEMTDGMTECNAYHFSKNYKNINIILPKQYENNEKYLEHLKNENYDLLFSNPPCSGLSLINRNASVDNEINNYIYKVFNMVDRIKPKTFLIENAPTLATKGLNILKDMTKILTNYRFVVINDNAGNHNVPMVRRRTLVIGFNQDYFNGIPIIEQHIEKCTLKDTLDRINNSCDNKEFVKDTNESNFKFYKYVSENQSFYNGLIKNEVDNSILPCNIVNAIEKIKFNIKNGKGVWDKSPYRPSMNGFIPSLASVVRVIHPLEDRDFYIREYAACMGYPDSFTFYQNECKTPIIQCIAQGVPVNFIRYISKEIRESFSSDTIDHYLMYINQCNAKNRKIVKYDTINEFLEMEKIDERIS